MLAPTLRPAPGAGILAAGPFVAGLLAIGLLALVACSRGADRSSGASREPGAPQRLDLAGIRERGTLRALAPRDLRADHLPRNGWPLDHERRLVESFARDLGLEPEWVWVDGYDELIPGLLEGRGDLIADNLTITEARRKRVAFSAPVAIAREQVVTRADDTGLTGPEDLAGRRFVVRRSSSYWESLEALSEDFEGIELEAAPEDMSVDAILEQVARGAYDLTLADSNLVRSVFSYRDDLRVAFDLDRDVVMAWALRPDAVELRRAADAFLVKVGPRAAEREQHTDDLPGIRERGVLRVITRNSGATYYIWRGELMGFEYDLAREFASRQGLRIELVVPPTHEDLFPWLLEGKGDVVAAGLSASPERAREAGVAFSKPYHRAVETVVARADDASVRSLEDLAGRRIAVRRGSSYARTLDRLEAEGLDFERVQVPDNLETEEIIARVASGEYDLTVADSHILAIELAWRDDVRAALELGPPVDHGWAMRPNNAKLREAVDAFFQREFRGTLFNVLTRKYFGRPERMRRHAEERAARNGRISRWDGEIRKAADRYGFDWRLIAAQMQQESRFDPSAVSFAGARGLLQILPRTAHQMGIDDLSDPEAGIRAGVSYLAWTRSQFPESLAADERIWFALAAYNVGTGHVQDARRIAEQEGLDPMRWFGHTERALLLKRKQEYANHSRFGYCRCSEPVRYVRAIRQRYHAYTRVAAP